MADEEINQYVAATELKDGSFMDVDQDDGGGGFESQKISGALLRSLFMGRADTITVTAGDVIAGFKAVLYSVAFPLGTSIHIVPSDTGAMGIGDITLDTETGFTIEVGSAGEFSFTANAIL